MAVTLYDIAHRAGVSVATVSHVVNGARGVRVSATSRRQILRIAKELSYRPNPYARALRDGRLSPISLVSPYCDVYITNLKFVELRRSLSELGREVLLVDEVRTSSADETLDMLLMTAPEAVVFLCCEMNRRALELVDGLRERNIHVLVIDPQGAVPADAPVDVVEIDRTGGIAEAVSHLVELGHRRIGLVSSASAYGRQEGYEQGLRRHGIAERFVELMDVTLNAVVPGEAQAAGQRLLERYPEVTAVFCGDDLTAIGVMRAARMMGRRIPDDLAIVGLCDEPWTEYLEVPVTALRQPLEEMCSEAVRILDRRLRGGQGPWERVVLKLDLHVRNQPAW